MSDIYSILKNSGVPFRLPPHQRIRRGWIGVDCPKCSPGHGKFRLGFEEATGRAHCWVCGSFYAPEILSLLLRISVRDARDLLGLKHQVRTRKNDDEKVPGKLVRPAGIEENFSMAHADYLESRGLCSRSVCDLWGIRSIGPRGGFLKWRLYIPIFDRFGREVSWTTRSINPENTEMRYYSANEDQEEVSHKTVLYGAHLARHTIAIFEGSVDCWTVGPGSVATLGVGFTSHQKTLMGQFPNRIVCFDSEDDAQRRADALCQELSLLPGNTESVRLETGKDPNSADPAEVLEFRKKYFPEIYENP